MKIVITDGMHEADYIISMYNTKGNEVVVINDDEEACKYLSTRSGLPVMLGKSTRETDLKAAGAEDADLFIAMGKNDMINYVACKTAKQLLGAKRCIATVLNPKNVEIFKKLGVDSAMSSTYLLGEHIRNAASIENLMNTLSIEGSKVIIIEFRITSDLQICNMTLKDISVSDLCTVSMVTRNEHSIIPNGNTKLLKDDKVLVVTTEENREQIVAVFQRKA